MITWLILDKWLGRIDVLPLDNTVFFPVVISGELIATFQQVLPPEDCQVLTDE